MKGSITYTWICPKCSQRGNKKTKRSHFSTCCNGHNRNFHDGKEVLSYEDRYVVYTYLGDDFYITHKDYLEYKHEDQFWELLDKSIELLKEYHKKHGDE